MQTIKKFEDSLENQSEIQQNLKRLKIFTTIYEALTKLMTNGFFEFLEPFWITTTRIDVKNWNSNHAFEKFKPSKHVQGHEVAYLATIMTGRAGQLAHIPRIPMFPTDLPIPFKRLQFPVKTSFALTINKPKPQGQTFELVEIDLRKKCFTHGQLYVGLSRVGAPENQFILLPQNKTTSNIVYKEALTQ